LDLKEFLTNTSSCRHPWEISRARFFVRLVRRFLRAGPSPASAPKQALDIGSGDMWLAGQILAALPAGSGMTCVDASYTPEISARLRRLYPNIESFTKVPGARHYDLLTLLDVVEHVENDRDFLEFVKDHIQAHGLIVISVPAFQSLFTAHDTWLGHFRRYGRSQLTSLCAAAGLDVIDAGGMFHSLLYARVLGKLRERLVGPSRAEGLANWSHGSVVTRLVTGVLDSDWLISEALREMGLTVPGLSWWCVCRKH
jgi:hypothetical protein